jgi:flagellar biosynthesis activator protein FlaF
MTASQLQVYRTVQKATISDREIEASVLKKAAFMLMSCQKEWDSPNLESKLDEALRFNQLLWSILQCELVKDDNPLPQKLREDILSLGVFIDKRIFDVMAFPAPEKLNIIIDINLNLAAGLSGQS